MIRDRAILAPIYMASRTTYVLCGLAFGGLALSALSGAGAGDTNASLVIVGGTVIDGTGRPPLPNGVIVIRDGKFVSVMPAGAGSPPGDARRIEATGKWIIPGLIDMHVHYHEWMDEPFLRHGVTTVRDVGANLERILALRRASRAGDSRQPRIFACGPLIDGPNPRHGTGLSVSVETEDEARDVARRLLARGVDCLKVYEQITLPLVRAIVQEAQRAGVPVTAHLRDTSAVDALEAGVRGLEHGFGFPVCDEAAGDAVMRVLLSRGAYVVPTLAITGRRLECLKGFVGRLARAGGEILAGSDTANSRPGAGTLLHRELELLVEAGLSPQSALAAATRAAASALGQGALLGTIEPGRLADLVIVAADPLSSIAGIKQVEVVIRDGRVVWPR
jgi:imidazolonepropionase-like amidohydrolase